MARPSYFYDRISVGAKRASKETGDTGFVFEVIIRDYTLRNALAAQAKLGKV
jgi:hypothetical protein